MASCHRSDKKYCLKPVHRCWCAMKYTEQSGTGRQKSMRRFDLYVIHCWKMYTTSFKSTCSVYFAGNVRGWTSIGLGRTVPVVFCGFKNWYEGSEHRFDSTPQLEPAEIDVYGNAVLKTNSHPALTSLYRVPFQLFPAAG